MEKIVIDKEKSQYKDYVAHDIIRLKSSLQKSIDFWETYLKDVPSLYFPEQYLIKDSEPLNTSIIRIPERLLGQLKSVCTANSLSITDSLTGAASACLVPYLNKNNKILIINFLKSTRESDEYDEAIGLFIRTDIIKIDLNDSPDFFELSKRVQKSIAETAAYQSCPIIIKLKKNKINNRLSTVFSNIYARLFPKYKLDYRILSMFLRVFSARKSAGFLIDVNIMNHFIAKDKDTKLFALDLQRVKSHVGDRTVDKNILNIWFDRDSEDQTNLILSGNLTTPFLETLGNDIIKTISENAQKSSS